MDSPISLFAPNELVFSNASSPVKTLVLENTCLDKLVFKVPIPSFRSARIIKQLSR